MRNRRHERKVCEAVIRLMEARKGETLTIIRVPDEKVRDKEAVDLQFRGISSEFVMEHTQIESFPQQITDDHRFINLLGPLEAELSGVLPTPGHYKFVVASGAVEGATDSKRIREALKTWLYQKAPTLQVGSASTAPHHFVREIPPGVPFEVTLYRWPRRDGKFLIARSVLADLEEKRKERIRSALSAKCPKLQVARGDNLTSVLVLESNDGALGNYIDIANVVIKELIQRRNDIPDDVYLVETDIEPWMIWILKEGMPCFPNIDDAGPHEAICIVS